MKKTRRQSKKTTKVKTRKKQGASRKSVAPRTIKQYSSMSPKRQDKWTQVTEAISKMRARGLSLQQASQESDLDPRTVVRLGGPALRKLKNGRYVARAHDRLLRVLRIPTPGGMGEIAVRDSRHASQIGEFWNALHNYQDTGDASGLRKFKRVRVIDANGARVRLLTDLSVLDRLGNAGELSFESIYRRSE